MPPSLILYDGTCGFCAWSVQFILDRDPEGHFHFTTNTSALAMELRRKHGLPLDSLETIVVIEGGRAYEKSDAAIKIAKELKGPWKIFGWAGILPRGLRDWAYNVLAENRHRLMGRTNSCRLPKPGERARFID